MLIEFHIVQNHAPSNLNRDDSGSPKSAIFGGYRRARISSQCLKRCYRTSKSFLDEVDKKLGMHTRSMPGEIKARLLDYADGLTAPELKAKFKEEAEKCQVKLAAILGKGGNEAKVDESEDEDQANGPDEETVAAEAGDAETGGTGGETNNLRTAQSVFWREVEICALFDAYRKRIEWEHDVPDVMRNAFDKKGKVKPKDMIKVFEQIPVGDLGDEIKLIKQRHSKQTKEATKKNDEIAANALMQLILERFDPKLILKAVGLRPEGIPVDMALFGRMVASPLMHNVEASSQFAHAISTHEFAREFDFWTRVDDRRDKRLDFYDAFSAGEKLESGADGMGDAEFTSACFYSYFNVDFDALMDNLTGKALKHDLDDSDSREDARQWACKAVVGLLKAAIFERPTGKFNSMASPSLPTLVLVEVRDSHVPVSYVDAFARPVDPKNEEKLSDTGQVQHVNLPEESALRLIKESNRINKAFCRSARKQLLFTGGRDLGVLLEPDSTVEGTIHYVDNIDKLVMEVKEILGASQE